MVQEVLTITNDWVTKKIWQQYSPEVAKLHQQLAPYKLLANEAPLMQQLKQVANEMKRVADVLVVVGIGGSYLGAKAVQDALCPYFEQEACTVLYVGHHMSGAYMQELLQSLEGKSVYVNAVSKSGATLESALAFRVLRQYMETRYGKEAKKRIIVTTDAIKGPLKQLADTNGYRQFAIPANIGGRYSVFTAAALLPLLVARVNIDELLRGATEAEATLNEPSLACNAAYRYAVMRHYLYKQGYQIELLALFEPKLQNMQQWWVQLFAESEGKQQRGLYPCGVQFPGDLHAVGQFIQQGSPILFETIVHINESAEDFFVPFDHQNVDALNHIAGMAMQELTEVAKDGITAAHKEADVPVVELQLARLDAYHVGYLLYFFMRACMMSAALLGVDPFDQPGVEAYKQNIAARLHQQTKHATLFS